MFREFRELLPQQDALKGFLDHLSKIAREQNIHTSQVHTAEPFSGEHSGVPFTLDAPVITSGNNQVLFVDVDLKGKKLQFVLKNDGTSLDEHAQALSPIQQELCEKYSAKLYAVIENHAVMERLHGLEGEKLIQHIAQDSQAAETYGKLAGILLVETATQGLQLHDIVFFQGHNVVADFTLGTVKCIERNNLYPCKKDFVPSLLCGDQLRHEIDGYIRACQKLPEHTAHLSSMLFALCEPIFTQFSRNELCVRDSKLSPLHPMFQSEWLVFMNEPLTPEMYERYRELARKYPAFSPMIAKATQMLHPDLYTALQQKDIAALHHCIENKTTYIDVEDKSHPFYGAEVIQP